MTAWRGCLLGGSLVAAGPLLSGCMCSPTYGTDKTANAQLMSDMGGIFSFSDKKKARDRLRAAAGTCEAGERRRDAAAAAGDRRHRSQPDWPESPEQGSRALRAEADANADNPNYESPIVADMADADDSRRSR